MIGTRDRGEAGRSRVVVAVALLYILLWSSAFIATKVGVTHSPPLTLLSVRFLCAAAILTVLARARGLPAPQGRSAWGRLALFGLLNCALYLGFGYESLRHLSAGMGSILAATNPLILALVAPRLLGERLTPPRVLGLILGFGGVIFVMGARLGRGGKADTATGMALQLAGVVCLVGATVVYKRRPPKEHPLVINAVQLGAAGLALVLPALLAEDPLHARVDAPLAWSFLYLVFVISIGASLLWFWLLARGEASVASAYYFLTPIFGLGLAAVAAGIALIGRPATRARATTDEIMPVGVGTDSSAH